MASVGNTSTLQVLRSVNTPDYTAPWIVLDEATADFVEAIPQKYRKWTGSAFEEMTQAEKDIVDAAELAARKDLSATEIVLSDHGRATKLLYAIAFNLAKLHQPALTIDQFLNFANVNDFTDQKFIDKIKEIT